MVMLSAGVLAFLVAALGGHVRLGVIAFIVLTAIGLLALVPNELTTVSLAQADERQQRMFFEALFASDYVVRAVVMLGLMTEMYRGDVWPVRAHCCGWV